MLLDLTYPLGRKDIEASEAAVARHPHASRSDLFGHLGTHLDLMGKSWPEDYFTRQGRIFDVRHVRQRDVGVADVPMDAVQAGDFVFFHTGSLAEYGYATPEYMQAGARLSWNLLRALTAHKVAMIGVDCSGVRLPEEHRQADLFCAEAGSFVVENVHNLEALGRNAGQRPFCVRTFPLRLEDATGLPCRILAEL
ncbi:MAG: cyclase family protein [Desulfovibrio sp.]|jgi:kynurenine formamidase|uniref:cyclase family protein n=1 Tax=Nitratidesulfovibrio sp. TaxID=2802297 RepID=UPI0028501400|nr:cyclase family protein [Desulfovibrio sp.]